MKEVAHERVNITLHNSHWLNNFCQCTHTIPHLLHRTSNTEYVRNRESAKVSVMKITPQSVECYHNVCPFSTVSQILWQTGTTVIRVYKAPSYDPDSKVLPWMLPKWLTEANHLFVDCLFCLHCISAQLQSLYWNNLVHPTQWYDLVAISEIEWDNSFSQPWQYLTDFNDAMCSLVQLI